MGYSGYIPLIRKYAVPLAMKGAKIAGGYLMKRGAYAAGRYAANKLGFSGGSRVKQRYATPVVPSFNRKRKSYAGRSVSKSYGKTKRRQFVKKQSPYMKRIYDDIEIMKTISQPQYFTFTIGYACDVAKNEAQIISSDRDLNPLSYTGGATESMDMDVVPFDIAKIYSTASFVPSVGQRVIFGRREFEYEILNQQNTSARIEVYIGEAREDHYSATSGPSTVDSCMWRDVNELIGLAHWQLGGSSLTNPGTVAKLGETPFDLPILCSQFKIKLHGKYDVPAGAVQKLNFVYDTPWVDSGYKAGASISQGGSVNFLTHLRGRTKTLIIRYCGEISYETTTVSQANRAKLATAPQFFAILCRKKYTVWFNKQNATNKSQLTDVGFNLATAAFTSQGSMNQNAPANLASLT